MLERNSFPKWQISCICKKLSSRISSCFAAFISSLSLQSYIHAIQCDAAVHSGNSIWMMMCIMHLALTPDMVFSLMNSKFSFVLICTQKLPSADFRVFYISSGKLQPRCHLRFYPLNTPIKLHMVNRRCIIINFYLSH